MYLLLFYFYIALSVLLIIRNISEAKHVCIYAFAAIIYVSDSYSEIVHS